MSNILVLLNAICMSRLVNIIKGSVESTFAIHILTILAFNKYMDCTLIISFNLKVQIAYKSKIGACTLFHTYPRIRSIFNFINTFLFFVVSNEPNPIILIISISSWDFPIRSWSVSFFPAPLGIWIMIDYIILVSGIK